MMPSTGTCSISAGCQIYSHDTVGWAVTGGAAPFRKATTTIGNCVYLGPGCIVAAGSQIGDHCVVGALSYVKGVLPPHSFAAGSPARIIGRVRIRHDNSYEIEKLSPHSEAVGT